VTPIRLWLPPDETSCSRGAEWNLRKSATVITGRPFRERRSRAPLSVDGTLAMATASTPTSTLALTVASAEIERVTFSEAVGSSAARRLRALHEEKSNAEGRLRLALPSWAGLFFCTDQRFQFRQREKAIPEVLPVSKLDCCDDVVIASYPLPYQIPRFALTYAC
jgi:hypothetical protein